ncbi:hypothetical protein [Candidatus Lucifugimonas marina]|uniref:Uncharacterized protein n=1 Tax=Candidatus Lucifugimonas marina TaxID=3038979 RepID=A0AAJ5ZDN4_9CHLR|nr:hypothetical protein [SAR202 cluster bacterium JH702]MDG0869504.1 hypothetical protein [SAR202 cluster bacterium JH639]WFG34241.1 hypothetical protein GKN94_00610 [SAR202 cluster bacterium JH545]WFG38171.1 hypothetical protein GKO48_00625 [SAR202 cluster bacterium JH1073]
MNNHDPGTHNGMLMGAIFDVLKSDPKKPKHPSFWARLGLALVKLTAIGLLAISPFILLALLVVLFDE